MVCSGQINNKQKIVTQKKDEYDDVINKYLQKIYDQIRKLFILRELSIENDKSIDNSYINEKIDLTVIDKSSEENIKDSDITQGENEGNVEYAHRDKK